MSVYRWQVPRGRDRIIHCGICAKRARSKTQIDGVFVAVCDKCWDAATATAKNDRGHAHAEEVSNVVRTMYRLSIEERQKSK